MRKRVFVSGCYDMLHSGHVAFFEEAAALGDLHVGIGSDRTLEQLKARKPVNTEAERLYMVRALRVVASASINSGGGILDFEDDLRQMRPDVFFVNADGHTPAKEQLCRELGIEYVVGTRRPHAGLPARSTTALRAECRIPYRIDLAGGWLDQPIVSAVAPGAVITLSIEPDYEFNDRSGMATSSRGKAIELWHTDLPEGEPEKTARTLFCYENPPGAPYVSGSQDAIGVVFPGLNRLWYDGDYWPRRIETSDDPGALDWLEEHLRLVQLYPREEAFDVLSDTKITADATKSLARASNRCWEAIHARDLSAFGAAVRSSFEAQAAMFPRMVPPRVAAALEAYRGRVAGYKLTGAGGGGYLILVTDHEIEKSLKIRVRRG